MRLWLHFPLDAHQLKPLDAYSSPTYESSVQVIKQTVTSKNVLFQQVLWHLAERTSEPRMYSPISVSDGTHSTALQSLPRLGAKALIEGTVNTGCSPDNVALINSAYPRHQTCSELSGWTTAVGECAHFTGHQLWEYKVQATTYFGKWWPDILSHHSHVDIVKVFSRLAMWACTTTIVPHVFIPSGESAEAFSTLHRCYR